jgi:hypothetical protein
MLFVLLVAALNFALGFALAVHFGHGPHGVDLSSPARLLHLLRDVVRGRRKSAVH